MKDLKLYQVEAVNHIDDTTIDPLNVLASGPEIIEEDLDYLTKSGYTLTITEVNETELGKLI